MEKVNEVNVLTKECIVTALLRLMETKSYQSISITDITSLAGVSRMAYYRNYKSKDDILINHLTDREKQLLKDLHGESANDLRGMMMIVSGFFQENADVIQAVYDAGLGHRLTDMLGERIFNYFPVAIEDRGGKYAVQFYVGAVLAVFKRWFDNGMVESIEDISDILCRLINVETATSFLVFPKNQ
ncbi:MAG: TetR/AcrR family transcriptional regulator [Clostridia bacterium]|nr:TetR/AcrR family transcriptional regulator [Clostridia bacterium]